MFLIDNNDVTDPRVNLALEEYCLRHLDPNNEYLLFYINQPSAIVGKHQIPFCEVNSEVVRKKGIRIVRRISGGGAVYHDYGNLNFSFITGFEKQKLIYFKKLIQPIVDTLHRLGVPAEITESNNIVVGGKKVSGTSQYTNLKRMLSHGTLLFDSDLDVLNAVLVSDLEIIQFRRVASVHNEVANISDYLSHPIIMDTFLKELTSGISARLGGLKEFQLSAANWDSVYRLSEGKYKTWDWTFGRSPAFTVGHKFDLNATQIYAHFGVNNGVIRDINVINEHLDAPAILKNLTDFIDKRYDSVFNFYNA